MNKVKSNLSSESLNVILNILNEIKYGTLTLVVQYGKVIQIERSKKIRLQWGKLKLEKVKININSNNSKKLNFLFNSYIY